MNMASNFHLKFSAVKGESKDDKHKEEIDIDSFSIGGQNVGGSHYGGGGGLGKVEVHDFSFSKKVDVATHALWANLLTHKVDPTVTFTAKKGGGAEAITYMTVIMTNALVTNIHNSGSGEYITESVTIKFETIEIKYQEQDKDGKKQGGEKITKFDVKASTIA
jgi:type VI secretion system secreted protein Hcp